MAKRKNKSKILRFNPNGLETKDRSYNNIKKLLNKKTSNIRDLRDQKTYVEETLRKYLEEKKYTVYLCKINFPLRITIIISPKLLKPEQCPPIAVKVPLIFLNLKDNTYLVPISKIEAGNFNPAPAP